MRKRTRPFFPAFPRVICFASHQYLAPAANSTRASIPSSTWAIADNLASPLEHGARGTARVQAASNCTGPRSSLYRGASAGKEMLIARLVWGEVICWPWLSRVRNQSCGIVCRMERHTMQKSASSSSQLPATEFWRSRVSRPKRPGGTHTTTSSHPSSTRRRK